MLRRRSTWRIIRTEYVLYLFVLPAVTFTFLFNYLPLFINVMAFMDYDIMKGWLGLGSPWVWFKNFRTFLTDPGFPRIALRTFYYAGVKLAFTFPAPIIFALLLNELRGQFFKRVTQTISYMPYFVSWVTVSALVYLFLSTSSTGIVNNVLQALGAKERIIFMSKPEFFLPLLVITDLWKNVGFSSIIYIAAIASIEQQLYEAATIDGAGRWARMRYITVPGIVPAVVIIAIITAGQLFNTDFSQIFTLQNPVIRTETWVMNVWGFFVGIQQRKYGLGTAISLFQSVVTFLLVQAANMVSKRVRGSGLF